MAGLVKFDIPIRLQNHQRQESYQKHFHINWSLDGISKSSLIQEALIECQPEFSSVECQGHPACSLWELHIWWENQMHHGNQESVER